MCKISKYPDGRHRQRDARTAARGYLRQPGQQSHLRRAVIHLPAHCRHPPRRLSKSKTRRGFFMAQRRRTGLRAAPIFPKIATALRAPSRRRRPRLRDSMAGRHRKHPIDFAFHGMPRPFHGVFPMEISHGFVTYRSEKGPFSHLLTITPQITRSLSDGYVFRARQAASREARKQRSHARLKIRIPCTARGGPVAGRRSGRCGAGEWAGREVRHVETRFIASLPLGAQPRIDIPPPCRPCGT